MNILNFDNTRFRLCENILQWQYISKDPGVDEWYTILDISDVPKCKLNKFGHFVPVDEPKPEPELKKPPLGLIPRYIHEQKVTRERVIEIWKAIERYQKEQKGIPLEWYEELSELAIKL